MITFEAAKKDRLKMNMAPLVDVVFLLLLFFLLTANSLGQGMNLNLPESQASASQDTLDLVVKIERDNIIKVDNLIIEIDSLFEELSAKLKQRTEKMVIIEADKKIRYGLFAEILDISREAGAEDFSIVK